MAQALGCVYKLVEVAGVPRMKVRAVRVLWLPGSQQVSEDPSKVTIPSRKLAFRLFDSQDKPVCAHPPTSKPAATADRFWT